MLFFQMETYLNILQQALQIVANHLYQTLQPIQRLKPKVQKTKITVPTKIPNTIITLNSLK